MYSRLTRGETHEYVSLKSEIGTHCSRLRSVFAPFFSLSVTKGCLADRHLKQLQSIVVSRNESHVLSLLSLAAVPGSFVYCHYVALEAHRGG